MKCSLPSSAGSCNRGGVTEMIAPAEVAVRSVRDAGLVMAGTGNYERQPLNKYVVLLQPAAKLGRHWLDLTG